MAGRFINTDRKGVLTQHDLGNTVNDLVQKVLNNPYYLYSDKKASEVTYYNLNTTMTTLDESTRGNFAEISPESPLRFNKINKFFLFGLGVLEPNYDIGEFGLESGDIGGDAIILPYTVVPYPGDYFYIDQLDRKLLFRVTTVNVNTLETGAVMYKISYTLASSDSRDDIEAQVVKVYNFIVNNLGTNFSCFMEEGDYNDASEIETILTALKDYYIALFYDNKIQSFSYNYNPANWEVGIGIPNPYGYHEFQGFKAYDPYLLEFMIRNNIMSNSTNYIYVQHQYVMPVTFPVDYTRTIFFSFEQKNIRTHIGTYVGNLTKAVQRLSLLWQYPIDYYVMDYRKIDARVYLINIFDDPGFADSIKNNEQQSDIMKNMVIKYFNSEEITMDNIRALRHIDYLPTKQLFYMIPMVIFILQDKLSSMMNATSQ